MIVGLEARQRGSVAGGVLMALVLMAAAACSGEAGTGGTPIGVEQSCAEGAPTGGLPVVVLPTLPPGTQPTFPAPGGGQRVVDVFSLDDTTYLLNPLDGAYYAMPWRVVVSPDGTEVAIDDGERIGTAGRSALIVQGESAVVWTDLLPGGSVHWSPDGTAVVTTSVTRPDVDSNEVTYTIQRFDVDSSTGKQTTIRGNFVGGKVGWAAESVRYVHCLGLRTSRAGRFPAPCSM